MPPAISSHGTPRAEPAAAGVDVRSRPKALAYLALTKPRIIELLLITTVPMMVVAEKGLPSLWLMVATVAGGTLSAGGANAINMYIDRDIDRLMDRTRNRPLVTGELTPRQALSFAVGIEALSVAWLWFTVNPLSALLALGACAFYVGIYTLWLKRRSTQNIVIGGAAGAAPVLIGWSSVTNTVAWPAVVGFLVVFFWTPPHFWALAIKYRTDYQAASVPMLPAVASLTRTSREMVIYTAITVVCASGFGLVAEMGLLYHGVALLSGAGFLALTVGLHRSASPEGAMRVFSYSITYLSVLFLVMVADQLLRSGF
ncbi:MAG: heme o synthase [Acidimicrobiales bacterium]